MEYHSFGIAKEENTLERHVFCLIRCYNTFLEVSAVALSSAPPTGEGV